MVCKVILVFRFGPRLGLKWKTWGQAEQLIYNQKAFGTEIIFTGSLIVQLGQSLPLKPKFWAKAKH